MPPHTDTETDRLIDRIKKLVAEQRRLDEDEREDHRRDRNRREIARLKWRLANVVKRELSPSTALAATACAARWQGFAPGAR